MFRHMKRMLSNSFCGTEIGDSAEL